MTNPPALFDRPLLTRRRARAVVQGFADFLHVEAAEQVKERLEEVNRTFTQPAIVGGYPDLWAAMLGLDDATCVADDEVLALAPGAHDLVIHALSLHQANDPVGQLVQCRRALKPDGLMLAVLFGGQSLSELRSVLAQAESEITGGLSPRVVPMADIRDLGGLLQRAGLALPVADAAKLTVTYADPVALMRDLRAMGETNVLNDRHKRFLRREVLLRAAALYQTHFVGNDGRITATAELVFLTGWAPSESQQKPLRPGSAVTRLADALGTREEDPER